MQRRVSKVTMMAALFAVAGCTSGFKDTFGLRRDAPDEFRVVSNAPLSLPPEFTLRPPVPGERRPQELGLDKQAKDVLFEDSKGRNDNGVSKGESIFLKKADAGDADDNIKNILNQEEIDKLKVKKKKGFWDKFASYTHLKSDEDPAVNAAKEKERIVENKKDGKPVNEGEVPVIDDGKKPFLKRIFGF